MMFASLQVYVCCLGLMQVTFHVFCVFTDVKHSGREVEAFKIIANSYHKRDLKLFETAFKNYKFELIDDPIIERHTSQLYQTLLEQNILKVLEPFSK